MKKKIDEAHIEQLEAIVGLIAGGNEAMVDSLLQYTDDSKYPKLIAGLAEHISSIIVQKEGREFLLELIIEDKLRVQTELEESKHDALTGIPNRVLFHEMLIQHCEEACEHGRSLGLLFIDLDRFKQVNDTMGHDAGDEILQQAAQRMAACIGDLGFVARLGGDEFTAVLHNFEEAPELMASHVAEGIISEMGRRFYLQAGEAGIGASIGITLFPDDADTPLALLKNADIAMYRAKDAGRNTYKFY